MPEQPCIRCGECATPCPRGLHPQLVLAALRRDDTDAALQLGLDACIGCGRCDEYCPSNIRLTERFSQARAERAQEQARHDFAMASRERYRARQARLQRETQEQAGERTSRRANHAAAQAVTAALARAKARREEDHGDTA